MLTKWTNPNAAGYMVYFLDDEISGDAVEQINNAYAHGGGWNDFEGFTLHDVYRVGEAYLLYPEDPPMRERSRTRLRDETIILFQYSWCAVVQPDGKYRVARID